MASTKCKGVAYCIHLLQWPLGQEQRKLTLCELAQRANRPPEYHYAGRRLVTFMQHSLQGVYRRNKTKSVSVTESRPELFRKPSQSFLLWNFFPLLGATKYERDDVFGVFGSVAGEVTSRLWPTSSFSSSLDFFGSASFGGGPRPRHMEQPRANPAMNDVSTNANMRTGNITVTATDSGGANRAYVLRRTETQLEPKWLRRGPLGVILMLLEGPERLQEASRGPHLSSPLPFHLLPPTRVE